MMKTMLLALVGILIVLPLAWVLWNSRLHVPSAPYTVVRKDGSFELRDYPTLTLATTPMHDTRGSEAFGHLFRFITGNNAAHEKIPMTTPVLINPATGKGTMSFVMPGDVAKKGSPEPAEPNVRLGAMEPGRYAVLRFQGNGSEKNQKDAMEKLNAWLHEHGITAQGEPVFAYYDPPWTPVFLRRNEAMVRVEKETR